jgi:imidazolonepropionase-like amidohydrolase
MCLQASAIALQWETLYPLEKGHYAGIIAVRDDPLADVTRLEKVAFVMKGGHILKNQF